MLTAIKIKLKPTKEQEILFWKSAGVARWSYNFFLSECDRHYKEFLNGNTDKKYIGECDVRKYINNVLKKTTHIWLSEIGSNVMIKPLKDMKNIQKQNQVIRNLHKRLNDIRNNYLHQCSNEIVKTKPSRIVMEDLNVQGMMKNKHLSKAVQQQCLYEFKRQIQYKSERHGIEFIEADRWYPSSKVCSCCVKIKKDLKLSDRIYTCECGNVIDRDLNAAINLANYQIQNT